MNILGAPGPTNIPNEVLNAIHQPPVEIYSGPLVDTTKSCLNDLAVLFGTTQETFIYIANGHGAWEAALTNTLSKKDKVLVLESGGFAHRWGDMAEFLGLEVETTQAWRWHSAVDHEALEFLLKEDKNIKAVLVCHVDTASGVVNDISKIRSIMNNIGSDALLLVDAIASIGTIEFAMDEWGVDVAMTCSQKGLMLPPGLSFMAASAKARKANKTADLRTRYWDWDNRSVYAHYEKYCGTPPVNLLYGLRTALDMIFKEGLENVYRRHQALTNIVHAAVQGWSEGGNIYFNIDEPSERSNSVTVVGTDYDPKNLIAYCKENNVILGEGILELAETSFRISHMGYMNVPMLFGMLSVIEMGFEFLNYPYSNGVQLAIQNAAWGT